MRNLSLLIQDESTEGFFDNNGTTLFFKEKTFKCVMLVEREVLKLLLMSVGDHTAFHSEAIIRYMRKNKLSHIALRGACSLSFAEQMAAVEAVKGSSRYTNPCQHHLANLLLAINPDIKIDFCNMRSPTPDEVQKSHRLFSEKEIQMILDTNILVH